MDARRASFELFGGSGGSQAGSMSPPRSVPTRAGPTQRGRRASSVNSERSLELNASPEPGTPEEVEDVEMENQGGNPAVTVRNRMV
ncbi:hypothetical protein R1sor_001944 [Riccia sorocarpa]|uniref:Uncharacterized protein n=1 Tax=Riccia sorocarpa TaxID=122646 RepID=A0ABD3GZX1_9MARC